VLLSEKQLQPSRSEGEREMSQDWEAVYRAAVLELDLEKMPEKIDLAVSVLTGRLRETSSSPKDKMEKGRIEDALRTLDIIRRTELQTCVSSGV
jgi:hypothetical protein